jgi:hypothetical protein
MDSNKRRKDGDDEKRRSLVNYGEISDRQVGDRRFEREKAYKQTEQANSGPAVSSTFDAFTRMAAGVEGRSLADKIADPNRPTWEQYKKDNEEKLDLVGNDVRKMVEYRAQLDKEREERLGRGTNHGKKSKAISDSDDSSSSDSDSSSSDDGASKAKRKHKKDKKKKEKKGKKHKDKKEKKSKKKRRHDDSGDDSDHQKKHKKEEKEGSMRLSDFMKAGYDSD